MLKKHKNKGFTLIEIVVAVAIIALLSGFVITSAYVIPQTRMKETAQVFKTEFEVARNYAKSHGGVAQFSIKQTTSGIEITTIGVEGEEDDTDDNKKVINDAALKVYYVKTGTGEDDEIVLEPDQSLTFKFAQTSGAIIGPDLVDYIRLDNRSKDYTLFIEHKTGMLYYDYELDAEYEIDNALNVIDEDGVEDPTFLDGINFTDTASIKYTGNSVQPQINYDHRYLKIGGVYRAVEAGGPYIITFTLKDPYEKKWKQNSPGWTPTEDEPFEVKELVWYIEP